MTHEEKEYSNQQLRGNVESINENPEFVNEKLKNLRIYIDQIADKAAYLEAQLRIPKFVNSVEFQLLFLRSSRFDSEAAAKKIVNYWYHKVSLFGKEVAFRPGRVQLSDLTDDDLATLDSLGLFCLPKEKANRGVLYSRRQNWEVSHTKYENFVSKLHTVFIFLLSTIILTLTLFSFSRS